MPKPTKYGLKEYEKAVRICAATRGYGKCEIESKRGSAVAFRLFEKEGDKEPCEIWVVHVGHKRKKIIWDTNLKEAWQNLGISEEEFMSVLENL